MRYARVKSNIVERGEDAGFNGGDQMIVDLILNDDDMAVSLGSVHGAFGWLGCIDYFPFVMTKSGAIDFGYFGKRNARTDLLEKVIRAGTSFSFRGSPRPADNGNAEAILQIKQVVTLICEKPAS